MSIPDLISPTRWPTQTHRLISGSAVLFATLRFVSVALTGRKAIYGDFSATLPGGYVEKLNPVLWNSADLSGSWAFHSGLYLHGPTQFISLYPIAYLNSYTEIARILLLVYAAAVVATVYVIWKLVSLLDSEPVSVTTIYSVALLYFPLLQAYIQREFEVVILLILSLLFLAATKNRHTLVGLALAYVGWFKYLPLVMLPYLAARRWWAALTSTAVSSIVWLLLAHGLFGLGNFVYSSSTNRDAHISVAVLNQLSLFAGGSDFCRDIEPEFSNSNATYASVRWGLCAFRENVIDIPTRPVYVLIVALTALAALIGFGRFELNKRFSDRLETMRWRCALELSILLTVAMTFVVAHYYYLSALILPLVILLTRIKKRSWSLITWTVSYLCLAPFVVPVSIVDRIFSTDSMGWYMHHAIYLYGVLLLLGMLLYEYLVVALPSRELPIERGMSQ